MFKGAEEWKYVTDAIGNAAQERETNINANENETGYFRSVKLFMSPIATTAQKRVR